jgi:hypothetical protein
MPARKKQDTRSAAEVKQSAEQQFIAVRAALAQFREQIAALCITPDPVDETTGNPILDDAGKRVKATIPTDTSGIIKAQLGDLNTAYKDTLKDATNSSVKKTPVATVAKAVTAIRGKLVWTHTQLAVALTEMTAAEASFQEQTQVAKGSIEKKRAVKAERERKRLEAAQRALAELGETA